MQFYVIRSLSHCDTDVVYLWYYNLQGGVSVKDLGIDLVGGVEDPQYPDNAVFVANIKQDSCALGKLK